MTTLKRNQELDLLKIIACIMVVLTHVTAVFISSDFGISNKIYDIAYLFNAFSRTAVPLFVLISGSFILNSQPASHGNIILKKRGKQLLFLRLFGVLCILGMLYC